MELWSNGFQKPRSFQCLCSTPSLHYSSKVLQEGTPYWPLLELDQRLSMDICFVLGQLFATLITEVGLP